jgi:molybdopterin converting factor subunit 1
VTVSVLFFASYADAFGREGLDIPIPSGATVAWLVDRLREMPGGAMLPARPAVAVNLEYADPGRPLADGDEVALIPPVAGG